MSRNGDQMMTEVPGRQGFQKAWLGADQRQESHYYVVRY